MQIHDRVNQRLAESKEFEYFGAKTDPSKMADLGRVRHDIHDILTNKLV